MNEQRSSKQLSFSHQGDGFSNALMFLQLIPRFDRRQDNSQPQRQVQDTIRVYRTNYSEEDFEISISGAITNKKNRETGEEEPFITWPGSREERVESAILKIATSDGLSSINTDNFSGYGCYFSVYQIRKLTGMGELDIREAIEVMNKSNLEIKQISSKNETQEGKASWSATYLPVKYFSTKNGPKKDKCYVAFHPAVMSAIDNLKYRPYPYEMDNALKKSLAKYLYKTLIINYIYASQENSYQLSMCRLFNDYGKISHSEEFTQEKLKNFIRDCRVCLRDLADNDVITPNYELTKVLDRNSNTVDITLTVRATTSFIKQQKKANTLVSEIKLKHQLN